MTADSFPHLPTTDHHGHQPSGKIAIFNSLDPVGSLVNTAVDTGMHYEWQIDCERSNSNSKIKCMPLTGMVIHWICFCSFLRNRTSFCLAKSPPGFIVCIVDYCFTPFPDPTEDGILACWSLVSSHWSIIPGSMGWGDASTMARSR